MATTQYGARDFDGRLNPGPDPVRQAPPAADPAEAEAAVAHEHPRFGGTRDEPRIVEPKVKARAGDRHRENLYALLIGVAMVVAIFALLYVLQIL